MNDNSNNFISIQNEMENESNVNTGDNAKNSMKKSVTYIIGDTRTEFTDYVEDGKEGHNY